MSQDLYNPPSAWAATGWKSLPAGWTPMFWPASSPAADQARVQNQAVQDIPPSQGTIQTASASSQRTNNAPVSIKTDTSALDGVSTNKNLYDMSEKDLKNNMGQLGVNIAKTTERNVIEEIQATMGGTTAFDKDITKLMYEKNRIRPMMMSTTNEYADPYQREKLIAMEEKRIEDKIVEVQAQKQSRLGTIDMALKAALEDKQNDLNAAAKLYEVYKTEVGDRREAEKLKLSMQGMILDIEKTKQEIAFNQAAMPYKLEQLKTEGNSMSRNPLTGEMEVYDRNGQRIDNQLPEQSRTILSQEDGYLPTDGKYRADKWGWYECGEWANKLTGMSSTPGGNDKSARKAAYNAKSPVMMGQVFFDWPGFDQNYGHIETVVSIDPNAGTFTTKGFNKNNDGRLTTATYSMADLQAKGVHVGFYNDTPAAKKLGQTEWYGDSNIERMITRSSYTEQEKQRIRADIKKNNLSEEQAQQIYFAPKNYAEAVQQLTFDGKETGQDLIKEIGVMASMFPEQWKAKVLQNYIGKLGDRAPILAEELVANGTYYYVDDKDKTHLADFSNDDDLYDGVYQLIEDLGEKKAKEILQKKLTDKKWFQSWWINDDKGYDTIQQAFEDAGYEF